MENILNILFYTNGALLLIGGIIIALISRNLIKMIIGFVVAETGINILLISIGYSYNKLPPILNAFQQKSGASIAVDPVPQALVLTSIVIGIATTALFLFYVLRFYKKHGTLNRDAGGEND